MRLSLNRLISTVATCIVLAAPAALSSQQVERRHALMPVPASVAWDAGILRLDSTTTFALTKFANDRLRAGTRRTIARLESRLAVPISRKIERDTVPPTIVIAVDSAGQRVQSIDENESYSLTVTPLNATLRARTVVGAMRGLETLLQLVESDAVGFYLPAVRIQDAPRFRWRGLLLDVGRHFTPVETIKRTLDGMAAVKMNVFHWHLSEDQGFRVESKRYPKLHTLGSDSLYYTQAQIREIVAYARDRGIRVVPEFDMPGHATAWFVGYPHLASLPGPFEIWRRWGLGGASFDPTREAVYTFIDNFIAEMAPLFPDRYWHVGGDEVDPRHWNDNPRIRAYRRQNGMRTTADLQAYFNRRLTRILTKHEKRLVGWDEVLHATLPRASVVQSWRGVQYLGQSTSRGHASILSAPYYLDHIRTAEEHYNADPIPPWTDLTPEQQALVLGGEACMWGEHVTAETVDSRIWPRLAAIAERLWSPRETIHVNDMYRRLWIVNERLEQLGLGQLAHTDRLVRRIAPDEPTRQALRSTLEAVAPPTFGQRVRGTRSTQLTPLVRMIDAAVPDPRGRWETSMLVDHLVSDSLAGLARLDSAITRDIARGRLHALFTRWLPVGARVREGAQHSPLVADAVPAAEALSRVAAIGLEALEYAGNGSGAPVGWAEPLLDELKRYEEPQALLRVMIVQPVRRLVMATSTPARQAR
ncbi:MAG TPA: family 20 glycosylhydrolase [Gemmatimonadaceae bacterium]|nr:family 20 glycosylhydrolase [Gemmatimonadaceae bacterium]